jgi:ABC-type bacteriocin/lantibiotic exporter with double-glycine peptidase domain
MVCVLIISLSLMGIEPVSIATLFGLLGAAIFRTLPFISRVTSSIQSLRFGKSAVDALTAEIDFVQTNRQPDVKDIPLAFEHEVTVENVSYTYPAIDKLVLDNINVNIPIGATIGIIGTTGAGKSTFVDVFLGLLNPTGGSVKCDGIDINTNIRGWQNKIGYVPQNIFLTDDSIRKNIAFGFHEEQINEELLNNAIDAAQLRQFISELPEGLDTLVGERGVRLSGGQRQRIGIARALYLEPSILVFDEATSSLDIHTEAEFIQSVSKLKGTKTILIVAHRLQTIMHCDTVYRIEQGRIVEKNDAATILKNYQEN